MNEPIKTLKAILLIAVTILVFELVYFIPKIADSNLRINYAKCLESYNSQGQPPLGLCGILLK